MRDKVFVLHQWEGTLSGNFALTACSSNKALKSESNSLLDQFAMRNSRLRYRRGVKLARLYVAGPFVSARASN